jgi:hypothetical protein
MYGKALYEPMHMISQYWNSGIVLVEETLRPVSESEQP